MKGGSSDLSDLLVAGGFLDAAEFEAVSARAIDEGVELQEMLARDAGLRELMRCAWFNPAIAPSEEHARMQFVLERPVSRTG